MNVLPLAALAVFLAADPAGSRPGTHPTPGMGAPTSSGRTLVPLHAPPDSAVAERGAERKRPSDQTESRPQRASPAAGARAILRRFLRSLQEGPLGLSRPEAAPSPAGNARKKAGDGVPACGRPDLHRAPPLPPAAFDELGFYRPLVDAGTEQVADSASVQRPAGGSGTGGSPCGAQRNLPRGEQSRARQ